MYSDYTDESAILFAPVTAARDLSRCRRVVGLPVGAWGDRGDGFGGVTAEPHGISGLAASTPEAIQKRAGDRISTPCGVGVTIPRDREAFC